MKKELQKKLSFVLFVMSVFFAGVALTVFSSSVLLICIAGVLLLATSVFYALQQGEKEPTPTEKTTELLMVDRMAELMRGNEKAEKGVYIAVKKQHEAMENGMAVLEDKITELVKAQESAVKTLVLYNKENAKQLALSEREELERLGEGLKQLSQGGSTGAEESMSSVVDAVKEMSHRLCEEMHESNKAMLSELGSTVDSLDEIKELLKHLNENRPVQYAARPEVTAVEEPEELPEPMVEPEPVIEPAVEEDPNRMMSADDIAALFAQAESVEPEPVIEPAVEEDPNRMMSADDIAALFAQAESAEPEPVIEPAAEEKPEDAFASSGVDLSDPNKTLSADDIAALFASLGN